MVGREVAAPSPAEVSVPEPLRAAGGLVALVPLLEHVRIESEEQALTAHLGARHPLRLLSRDRRCRRWLTDVIEVVRGFNAREARQRHDLAQAFHEHHLGDLVRKGVRRRDCSKAEVFCLGCVSGPT